MSSGLNRRSGPAIHRPGEWKSRKAESSVPGARGAVSARPHRSARSDDKVAGPAAINGAMGRAWKHSDDHRSSRRTKRTVETTWAASAAHER